MQMKCTCSWRRWRRGQRWTWTLIDLQLAQSAAHSGDSSSFNLSAPYKNVSFLGPLLLLPPSSPPLSHILESVYGNRHIYRDFCIYNLTIVQIILNHLYQFPKAIIEKYYQLGSLKQEKFIFSQSRSLEAWKLGCWQGCFFPLVLRENAFHAFVLVLGGCWQSAVFLGLWLHHPDLCLHDHVAFSSLDLFCV